MTSRPKIGLVGYFGWGNFGDELFLKAHQEYLKDIADVFPVNDLTESPYISNPIEQVVSEFDAFIIGGGDLIVPWQVSELYWKNEYLRKPTFVIGVGVPTWRASSSKAISAYRNFLKSPSLKLLIARDRESTQWINRELGPRVRAEFHPDLVCAMKLPEVEKDKQKTFGLVLRRRKHNDDLRHVRSLCKRAERLGYQIKHIVLGNRAVGAADLEVAKSFAQGAPIVHTESLTEMCEAIGGCHMMASMKFHGAVVACMYGVPCITMSGTDKNRNFLRMIERQELQGSFDSSDLRHRVVKYPAIIPSISRRNLRRRAIAGYEKLRACIEKL